MVLDKEDVACQGVKLNCSVISSFWDEGEKWLYVSERCNLFQAGGKEKIGLSMCSQVSGRDVWAEDWLELVSLGVFSRAPPALSS
ncbi:hypothetical protein TURU_064262 [Turdus rufiventris]|nr:hypothetical protein TURU_064262 [Turdus rufiventris]